jgi:hypothetical protein
LLIASADKTTFDAIKKALSMKFEMKDMGEARKCLGLEIFRCRKDGTLSVSQSEYAKTVLARYNMAEIKGANTPMECGIDVHDTSELAKGDVATIEICGIADNSAVERGQKGDEVYQTNLGSWCMLQIWWQV